MGITNCIPETRFAIQKDLPETTFADRILDVLFLQESKKVSERLIPAGARCRGMFPTARSANQSLVRFFMRLEQAAVWAANDQAEHGRWM